DEQPGELAGYGPIPAQMARRIADDETGTWRRLITDDHGRLVDYGRQTYRPPARLAAFIIARDQTCTFTSCTRPAVACDLDHLRSAKDGGPTCEGNLHPLCRRHHRCKHQTDWLPERQTRRIHHLDQSHRPHPPHEAGPATHHRRGGTRSKA
ncbi:MAG: HNH endonuclease signature motif containing protein, partial [Jatrophihabitans sp.]